MPKAKIKTPYRLSRVGKMKFDKLFIAVCAVITIAAGGYLFYQGTHAVSLPPARFYSPVPYKTFLAKATDGVSGYVTCPPFRITVYPSNPGSICVQGVAMYGTAYFREGYYNFSSGVFNPEWPVRDLSVPIPPPPYFIDGNYLNDVVGGGLGICSDGRTFVVLVANANTHMPYYSPAVSIYSFGAILHWDNTAQKWTARAGYMTYRSNICSGFSGSVAVPIIGPKA